MFDETILPQAFLICKNKLRLRAFFYFKLQQLKKDSPIPYVEQFDFVNPTYDEHQLAAQISIEDRLSIEDGDGDLIIRQRLKYNGKFRYKGNFEHHYLMRRQFNGTLNYNGVHVTKSNGSVQYDGQELYGDRKNIGFFERIDNLSGDFEIRPDDNIPLPIATRSKLGFVIVGKNLRVDSNGKISLVKKSAANNFTEVEAGLIPELFNSWRN